MKPLPIADIIALEPSSPMPTEAPSVPVFPPAIKAEWLRILRTTIPINNVYMQLDTIGGEARLTSCCALGGLMYAAGLPNIGGVKQALFIKFPQWTYRLQTVEEIHGHDPCVYDGRNKAIAYIEVHF